MTIEELMRIASDNKCKIDIDFNDGAIAITISNRNQSISTSRIISLLSMELNPSIMETKVKEMIEYLNRKKKEIRK